MIGPGSNQCTWPPGTLKNRQRVIYTPYSVLSQLSKSQTVYLQSHFTLQQLMKEIIVNRVAQSSIVTFDLEALYPKGPRIALDIKPWLHQGLVVREKEFRQQLETHDWTSYTNAFVALHCSTGAIVPAWGFMLVASKLLPVAQTVVVGSLEDLEIHLYQNLLNQLDVTPFKDKPVIIKGCAHKPVPENAYLMALAKIQLVAKRVLYGEACSSVPIFKRK